MSRYPKIYRKNNNVNSFWCMVINKLWYWQFFNHNLGHNGMEKRLYRIWPFGREYRQKYDFLTWSFWQFQLFSSWQMVVTWCLSFRLRDPGDAGLSILGWVNGTGRAILAQSPCMSRRTRTITCLFVTFSSIEAFDTGLITGKFALTQKSRRSQWTYTFASRRRRIYYGSLVFIFSAFPAIKAIVGEGLAIRTE